MNEDDDLELLLGLQFAGLEQAQAYRDVLASIVRQEGALSRALGKSNEAMREAERLRQSLGAMPGMVVNNYATAPNARKAPTESAEPAKPKEPTISGPNARFQKSYESYQWARKSGTGAQKEDAEISMRRAVQSLETARRGGMTAEMQALYSTRMNLPGGAAPLLGKTLEAGIGPAATRGVLAGLAPIVKAGGAVAGTFLIVREGLQMLHDAAAQSAAMVGQYTSSQAASGGSTTDIARMSLVGGRADAARAFNDRITSNPEAMMGAAQIGIVNQKGAYGNLNWTRQYVTAIERASAMTDESLKRQLVLRLGIEQEVATYSLLSEATKKALKAQAETAGRINDPRAQALGAEFTASQNLMEQSIENVKNAAGQLFSEDIAGLMNEVADWMTKAANWLHGLRGERRQYSTFLGALTGGLLGDSGQPTSRKSAPMSANTMALNANTEAISRLNGTIGSSANSRTALPDTLRGPQLYEARRSQALRLGALG